MSTSDWDASDSARDSGGSAVDLKGEIGVRQESVHMRVVLNYELDSRNSSDAAEQILIALRSVLSHTRDQGVLRLFEAHITRKG